MENNGKSLKDICFIYEVQIPEFPQAGDITTRINFMGYSQIEKNLLNEDPFCKLVFFPLKLDKNIFYKEIRTMFPRAEFFSYSADTNPECERISRELNFTMHLYLPLSLSLVKYIYENSSCLINEIDKKLAIQETGDAKILSLFNEVLNILNLDEDKSLIYKEFGLLMNRLVESENFMIYIFIEEKKQLELVFAIRNVFEENRLLDFKFNNVILDEAFQKGEAYINNHFNYEIEAYRNQLNYLVRSILVYPFKKQNRSRGVFVAVNKRGAEGFTESDAQCIRILTNPFILIHDSLVDHERVQRLTVTDDLTNLYNFRYLRQYLGIEIKRSLRYEKTLSLLFIDIDNFKNVNDTYGHLVGSATLCEVGQIFSKQVRDTDVIVRYGGDEFVIILPETPLDGAKIIAERLRERVENFVFNGGKNLKMKLTVSVGIATCPMHALTAEGLLQKADAAMYMAKEDSKNKIMIAG